MAERSIAETLLIALDAFNRNDLATAAAALDPQATYTIRGRSAVSGTFRGPEAIADAIGRVKDLTGGTITMVPELLLSNESSVMMYARLYGERPDGRRYDSHHAYVYRFRDGRLVEGEVIPADQRAFEEFVRD